MLAGCSSADGTGGEAASPPTPTGTSTPSPSPTRVGEAPLTGEPVTDVDVLSRPVLAVKIENSPKARPQTGLDVADVVYEQIVEGGVTRFVALFQSELPEVVGPVRSARLVDVSLLPAFHPILAYSGARGEVTEALRRAGIALVVDQGGSGAFYREPGRPSAHDLFARVPGLYQSGLELEGVQPPDRPWTFDEAIPEGAVPCEDGADCPGQATSLRMTRTNATGWDYDADAGVYRRSQNGAPTRVTGPDRVGAANVVAIGTRIGTGGCCDSAGAPFVTTQVVGTGRGVILRDGQAFEITWTKPSATEHLRVLFPDGRPFPLKPGPTWWHLMPEGNLPSLATAAD